MAAARARGLTLVHSDAAVFQYDVVQAVGLTLGSAKESKQARQVPQAPPARPELPRDRPDSDAELDFLAIEPEAEAAIPNGGATDGPEPAASGDDLLGEFIPLGEAAAAVAKPAAATDAGQRPELLKRVPWLKALKGIRSPLLRLHQEIVEFCRYLEPSPEEAAQREGAIQRVSETVKAIWPSAEVHVFGSFATGLYLPTSDVDAVVVNSGCTDIPRGLKALAQSLLRKHLAKQMQVIAKAKVPIIKFEEAESGYNFDISFDVANGPEAAENVRSLMDSLPPMRPLVMVLKVFLQQRELNEVYSGGLGSYALLVMVAAFLQLHPSRQPHSGAGGGHRFGSGARQQKAAPLEGNLGVLLVDFLRLYGRSLNNEQVGVSCRRGGSFFSKRAKGFHQVERPYLLAVEDPNDPENDLGRNSYNVSRVRSAFDWAYNQLTAPCEPHTSLLARILRLDPVLFLRGPPPALPGEDEREKAAKKERGSGGRRRDKEGKQRKRRERSMSTEPEGGEEEEEEEDAGPAAEGRQGGRGRHKLQKRSPREEGGRHSHHHRPHKQPHHRQQGGGGGGSSHSRHIRFD